MNDVDDFGIVTTAEYAERVDNLFRAMCTRLATPVHEEKRAEVGPPSARARLLGWMHDLDEDTRSVPEARTQELLGMIKWVEATAQRTAFALMRPANLAHLAGVLSLVAEALPYAKLHTKRLQQLKASARAGGVRRRWIASIWPTCGGGRAGCAGSAAQCGCAGRWVTTTCAW